MIFKSLTLEDFGTYAGRQQFDLTPEADRPIVLVGGHNGSGKTTILEALLLCLHGRRALWSTVSQREYDAHMLSRFHAPPAATQAQPAHLAAVSLTFMHTDGGVTSDYRVQRAWRRTSRGAVKETLVLFRDEEEQEDLTGTMTQSFLNGLLPPALAGLFFFDGEKIQSLADDETGRELRDAVRRLLGLDVLERLRTDLGRYATRTQADARTTDAQSRVVDAQRALEAADAELADALREFDELEASRTSVLAESRAARERFDAEGGAMAEARADLERRRNNARIRLQRSEEKLRELIVGLLPLALAPNIADALSRRLAHEQELEEHEIVRRRVAAAAGPLNARLSVKNRKADLVELITLLLAGDGSDAARVHDVTSAERVRMLDALTAVRSSVPGEAKALAKQLRRARTELAALEDALDRAPEPGDLAPLIGQLQEFQRWLGSLDQEVQTAREQAKVLQFRRDAAERELQRAQASLLEAHQASDRSTLALKTIALLTEFESETAAAKMRAVELATARYFNRLSRKGDMLADVSIDLETFALQLKRWDQSILPKARLSAGERQLLAIALLWALASVSGRPVPVVIDTPLARLDQLHRQRLVTEYLPAVSHQVIVLSTDAEVDERVAATLEPFVVRSYRLDHRADQFATEVSRGYFESAVSDAR